MFLDPIIENVGVKKIKINYNRKKNNDIEVKLYKGLLSFREIGKKVIIFFINY